MITTPAFREFVLHARSADEVGQLHDELRAAHPTLDVQMYAESDPTWSAYTAMIRT